MLSTHGVAARDSSSSPPFVDLEEQPESGLRHCTSSCKALSVMVRQWWQGTSQAPAHHPLKPAMLHQHKQWFQLTIYEKQVPTAGSNSAIKRKLVSQLHKVSSLPQLPTLAFTKHFFLIKITCQEWCKALAGSREDAPSMGSTTSTGCVARHSLHQPSSEMGRAKVFSWHRPKTKLRMAGNFLFELQLFLPSLLSRRVDRRISAASHTLQPLWEQHKT